MAKLIVTPPDDMKDAGASNRVEQGTLVKLAIDRGEARSVPGNNNVIEEYFVVTAPDGRDIGITGEYTEPYSPLSLDQPLPDLHAVWNTSTFTGGRYKVRLHWRWNKFTEEMEKKHLDPKYKTDTQITTSADYLFKVDERDVFLVPSPLSKDEKISVTLKRTEAEGTHDQSLWAAIRNRTKAISFEQYRRFLDSLLLETPSSQQGRLLPSDTMDNLRDLGLVTNKPGINLHGAYPYELLRIITDVFLTLECGVIVREGGRWRALLNNKSNDLFGPLDESEENIRMGRPSNLADINTTLTQYMPNEALPYIDRIVTTLSGVSPNEPGYENFYRHVLAARSSHPALLELIWSYWHEEGMLVQTMNAIALRFQNKRRGNGDALAEFEIDPLRPLNNLMWGYIQSEYKRLTVQRRAYEYDHHYGLSLYGKAIPQVRAADTRSKFLEAFHNVLYLAAIFYREDSDTTVVADAFPLLNGLKEVHLILAEGAHNQYGDLPWTARAEMLIEKWLLSRPEMRDFLRGRIMVPYPEPWMGQADAMKRLQGWTDTTVTHFHDLGVFGEQILLSIRFGDWSDAHNEDNARNWARYWKPEIQGYIHAYRSATSVDLSADITDTRQAEARYLPPSVHLRSQLTRQTSGRAPAQLTHEPAMALPSPRSRQLQRS